MSQAKEPLRGRSVYAVGTGITDPIELLTPVSRHISEALELLQSKSTSPEQREAAILLIIVAFRKCSWLMRRLVVDLEAPRILEQFIEQTYFNCALLQTASQIDRRRIREIAREMPDFPILQSAGSHLRERARLFLRSIDLGGKLPGGRGSTRWTNTVFMRAAGQITEDLYALLKTIPILLNHPDPAYRLDKNQLEPAYQNALDFFKSINFDISGGKITLKNWPCLWNIISTLIVTERSPRELGPHAYNWCHCSWSDFYENDDLRRGITARSHQLSEARVRSHIRDKIKKKIEAQLRITKLRKTRVKR